MTKNEAKQVENAKRAAANGYAHLAARELATLQRCGSTRTQREIAALVDTMPEVKARITIVNGCFIAA
jgi:hypothetical protein